jgi:hypothetical protein
MASSLIRLENINHVFQFKFLSTSFFMLSIESPLSRTGLGYFADSGLQRLMQEHHRHS